MSPAIPAAVDRTRTLLELVGEFCRQLHPDRRPPPLRLDSALERDLGLDSLARVELRVQIEKRFDVTLPERSVAEAETVRDLLPALERATAGRGGPLPEAPAPAALEPVGEVPEDAATLVETLDWHVRRHPDRPHIFLYGDAGRTETIAYGELLADAEAVASRLRGYDLDPGQPVALMLPTCRAYFGTFLGVILAGGVPVPLYPPHRMARIEEHVRRQAGILSNARAPILIASPEVQPVGVLLKSLLPDLRHVLSSADLLAPGGRPDVVRPRPSDPAMLQYTSGSTGDPKGVILTHANLLANVRAMKRAAGAVSSDVFVSWLPLYHDMGLIGGWLGSLYNASLLVLMSPTAFLDRPERWLWAVHAHRGTISAAPNFAYDLCASRIDDSALEGLDLGSWRLAFNGAECVYADTIARFCERFAPFGFRPEAMMPVYGLAESSVGLTFPPPGRGAVVDRVRRDEIQTKGRAVPAAEDDPHALRFVSCGSPLPDHEVRIVDESGIELGDREQGRLQFRGPSATAGYYRNPKATRRLLDGGWLDSGDCAYAAGGEFYITGRLKDMIVKYGRNIHPQGLEEAVGRIPGVRRGCVSAFESADPRTGSGRLVLVAETRERSPERREAIRRRINEVAMELLDAAPDDVVLAPPRAVPKTLSGKLRRQECRRLYERGEIGRPRRLAGQFVRLGLSSLRPVARRARRVIAAHLYSAWAWALFTLAAVLAWIAVMILPERTARRRAVQTAARLLLRLAGLRVRVTGLERLPSGPCVVVANHASYLDSVLMSAILPPRFGFVAKKELAGFLPLRAFLRRLGTEFVERFDLLRAPEEGARVAETIRRGDSVVVFPEGTFFRAPGLREFRMGAFVVAARTGSPVMPVAIRGARSILRGEERRVRRGEVEVSFAPPITPAGDDWAAAVRLRAGARAEILRACGEPDLAQGA